VSAQSKNVFVNGKLWAVDGDPNTDGAGNLIAATNNVFIGGKKVCNNNDKAVPDGLCPIPGGPHCSPDASGGSGNVYVGD
jgi:uncharacterized Zn-binding protein involved in type VI secretion